MMYKFGNNSLAVLDTVKMELRVLMKESIKNSPHDFTIIEGKRSLARQQQLYRQGRSEPGKIVTKCDGIYEMSGHQVGKAVDIAIYDKGKNNYNVAKMWEVRKHIENKAKELEIKLKEVIKWDLPHYEIK